MRRVASALTAALTGASALVATAGVPAAQASVVPTATTFAGQPQVGPLFLHGTNHGHTCVATVIASRTRNVIMTAAHCIAGTGQGVVFAPGYHAGRFPYGSWTVIRSYVDPMWKAHRDARYDYALLVVAPNGGRQVQSVTGGYALGLAQASGTTTTVPAYRVGLNDNPVRCTTRITRTNGFPTFGCHGYPDGVSGAPFLVGSYITGVIGGPHHGGCVESTSYSSAITAPTINALYARAVAGAAPSLVPVAGSDGC